MSQFKQRRQTMPSSAAGSDFNYFDHNLCPVKFVLAQAPGALDDYCQIVPSYYYDAAKGPTQNSRVVMQVSLILKDGDKSIITPSQPIFFSMSVGDQVCGIIESSGDDFSDPVRLGHTVFEIKKELNGKSFKYVVQRMPKAFDKGVDPALDDLVELSYAYMLMNRRGTNNKLLEAGLDILPRITQREVEGDSFTAGFFAYVQAKASDMMPDFFEGFDGWETDDFAPAASNDSDDIPF